MKVNELKARQGNVDIVVDLLDVGSPREFQKFGKAGRVATAVAKDETGDIKLTLWNEDIDRVKAGDKIHLTNGYVSEWQGELQLTTGRLGKIEIVGKSEAAPKIMTNFEKPADESPEENINVEEEDIDDIDEEEI